MILILILLKNPARSHVTNQPRITQRQRQTAARAWSGLH